ncbi:MAG: glycoside hydrolase family 42 [Sphingomonas hengshuiensis]|uniref:Glycoside hydrolase family 42 n=2 Tax=Sphingomonas TaxID=13687 RepID=A0A2W4ZE36_9SPHN|nr:MAG: glycoside hydrolase family 42 [Sphingomonas hengshuiensis]
MRSFLSALALVMAIATPLTGPAAHAQSSATPRLERRGDATQLIVEGKPYLMLGGETRNSSSSDVTYMAPLWPKLRAMNLNTVLVPVAWETIEPTEGRFDFSNVDGLLKGARENDLRIVILWFGAWKNTYSSYVPAWVKRDQQRFGRVQTSDGRGTERLSPFSAASRDADARAFGRLMRHIREVDGTRHTVLMVQVENEVGIIPESRDHSPAAEAAFNAPVPEALMRHLSQRRAMLHPVLRSAWEHAGARSSGTWREVFGDTGMTDALFMSWAYATFIESVTAAGKAEYALPMFTNAALIRPNYEPGQYNSGGPLPFAIDLYKGGAPSLDFLSPDIYFEDYVNWATQYTRRDNPLFVPEARGGAAGAANALYSYGTLGAIGFSPFGIDGQGVVLQGDASIGLSAAGDGDPAMAALYGQLAPLAPMILQAQAGRKITTVMMEGGAQRAGRGRIGDYIVNMSRAGGPKGDVDQMSRIAAMFIQTGADEFIVVGSGDAQLNFTADTPGAPIVGIESIDEQYLRGDQRVNGRRLNGDETGQGQSLRLFSNDAAEKRVYRVRLYRYR